MRRLQGKKRFSALVVWNNYRGFTLVECLVALSILSLVLLMLSGVFTQSQWMSQRIQGRQELEWHVFLVQLEKQLTLGTFKSVKKGELTFERTKLHEGKVVTFSIKRSEKTQSIYLSDNGGMERMLTQVTNLVFQQVGTEILFTVTFTNGEEKIGKWTIP